MGTFIQQPVQFFHELPAIFLSADVVNDTIQEFAHDAEHAPELNHSWGCEDIVLPLSMFDITYDTISKGELFEKLQSRGIVQFESTEIDDKDEINSITLIAFDERGSENFRQALFFYDA